MIGMVDKSCGRGLQSWFYLEFEAAVCGLRDGHKLPEDRYIDKSELPV